MSTEDVKLYLKQNRNLDELIQSNRQELNDLETLKRSIPGIDYSKDRVQVSPSNEAAFARIVEKICLLENDIRSDIENLLSLKLEIRTVINAVKNNEEKLVLKYRYLNFLSWDEVADKMNVSIRTACRLHVIALRHVKIPESF